MTERTPRPTLRLILYVFLLTFLASRITVFLIMDHRLPDLYLHVGGNHVHHLNYGIFLLSFVGAWLLVFPPHGRRRTLCTIIYGVGLGLTFDEFGMWWHLGGPYWQRASFDAVVTIAGLLALAGCSPAVWKWGARHWIKVGALAAVLAVFSVLFAQSLKHAEERIGRGLHHLDEESPP